MARFGKRDVTAILELLENGLDGVPGIDKIEKMKWRARIRQQENFLMGLDDPKPEKVVDKLAGRLTQVFRLYPHGFSDKLTDLIKTKVMLMDKMRPESSGTPK